MPDYTSIRNYCKKFQQLNSTVIDGFLIYYAAQQDRLNREAEKKLARYRHISKIMPEGWRNMSITQYIGHRVFRRGGLINKYINHSGLSHLTDEEMAFLELQKEHPWRFSFAEVTGRPEPDFFEMSDQFTGEAYLIYSPGMTRIQQTQNPTLWFNLIGFNGKCFEAYGPIAGYSGFERDDILFFATELNRGKWFENGRELMDNVEENPVPYLCLFSGSNFPLSYHKEDQIVQVSAEYLDDSFNTAAFGDKFKVEYNHGVYKLSLKGWEEFPHYTAAYYDEKEELLFLNSMTDRGFRKLIDRLNECGYRLSYEPDVRLNMAMVKTANDILKKEIELNRYDKLFSIDDPDENPEGLENINTMLAALIPAIITGEKPDLDALAAQYGVDPETAREIYGQLSNKMNPINPVASIVNQTGGLNPNQIYDLVACNWEKNEGPVQLNGKLPSTDVSGSILFHNARTMLLKAQKEDGLGLTQTGNLQRKPISGLLPECRWPEGYLETIKEVNKVLNEHDVWLLHSTRVLLEIAGLLRKYKGKLKGVKKMSELSLGSRSGELYRHLFITYFRKMNISYLTNNTFDFPNLQANTPFTLFRLQLLADDWVSIDELPEQILLPLANEEIATRSNKYTKPDWLLYTLILKPLELFGLMETRKTGDESEWSYKPDKCRKTPLFDKFITFRV
ncbi:MAG: hypothetical protein EA391_14075 [Balneolaceae bacterium]|nr:MAG: hypothetical protein EA391_14075 [Balneolaceae bacterium]